MLFLIPVLAKGGSLSQEPLGGFEIPTSYIANTGDQTKILEAIDRFFGSVLETLGYDSPNSIEAWCKIHHKELAVEDAPGDWAYQRNQRISDDIFSYLIARNRMVASVMQRRNDFNYIEVSFAAYLDPAAVEQAKRPAKST